MNVRVSLVVSIVALVFITTCSSYRILGVFPFPAPSHYFLGKTLLQGIAEAGHDVTIISPFSEKIQLKNGSWREIYLDGHENLFAEKKKKLNATSTIMNINPFRMVSLLVETSTAFLEATLKHPNVQTFIASNEKFDAIIVPDFLMDGLKALANKFDAHLISFSNHAAINWYYNDIGHFVPPSAFPEVLLSFPAKMNFLQRVTNTVMYLLMKICQKYIIFPKQEAFVEKIFPGSPPLRDIVQNVSLVLVNSHNSLNFAYPKVPIMIEIGGFHIKPAKQLPSDLQQLLDNAKEGVIYFSMGSNFKSDDLPVYVINTILNVFSKRKEQILWKWGEDVLSGKPENVHISKWFPQQDILAHPNVKLFITHSGFLSTTETIYHGVPIVSIPLAGDQKLNAKAATQDGYALTVLLDKFNDNTFGEAIEEVISNPKYKNAVQEKSKLFHDRQRPPIEDAVYWIEYVIRHNGAKHLRVASADLQWYQYYLLDVFGFITVVLFMILYILKKFFGYLVRKCFVRRPKLKKS